MVVECEYSKKVWANITDSGGNAIYPIGANNIANLWTQCTNKHRGAMVGDIL